MKPILSVQLYSLRDAVEREGLEQVLAAVRESGFAGVELAGLYGLTPSALKAKLDAAGLVATSAHVGMDELAAPETLKATADALGFKDIVAAWSDASPKHVDTLLAAAKALPGYRIGYHNHAHEFEPQNAEFLQKLLAADVWLEPDIFWLKVAGLNPIEFLHTHAQKILAVHMKELSADGREAANPVPGQGVSGCVDAVKFAAEHDHRFLVLEAEKFDMPYRDYLAATAKFFRETV